MYGSKPPMSAMAEPIHYTLHLFYIVLLVLISARPLGAPRMCRSVLRINSSDLYSLLMFCHLGLLGWTWITPQLLVQAMHYPQQPAFSEICQLQLSTHASVPLAANQITREGKNRRNFAAEEDAGLLEMETTSPCPCSRKSRGRASTLPLTSSAHLLGGKTDIQSCLRKGGSISGLGRSLVPEKLLGIHKDDPR